MVSRAVMVEKSARTYLQEWILYHRIGHPFPWCSVTWKTKLQRGVVARGRHVSAQRSPDRYGSSQRRLGVYRSDQYGTARSDAKSLADRDRCNSCREWPGENGA